MRRTNHNIVFYIRWYIEIYPKQPRGHELFFSNLYYIYNELAGISKRENLASSEHSRAIFPFFLFIIIICMVILK